jgi:hypothetical protein
MLGKEEHHLVGGGKQHAPREIGPVSALASMLSLLDEPVDESGSIRQGRSPNEMLDIAGGAGPGHGSGIRRPAPPGNARLPRYRSNRPKTAKRRRQPSSRENFSCRTTLVPPRAARVDGAHRFEACTLATHRAC